MINPSHIFHYMLNNIGNSGYEFLNPTPKSKINKILTANRAAVLVASVAAPVPTGAHNGRGTTISISTPHRAVVPAAAARP